MMKNLLFIQPVLYDYRIHVINGLLSAFNVYALAEARTVRPACTLIVPASSLPFDWLRSALPIILQSRKNIVAFMPAYTTHLGIVSLALILYLFRIPLYIHGQAVFKKPKPNFLDIAISFFWLTISNRYISYSPAGVHGPFVLGPFRKKVFIVNNRFESLSCLGLKTVKIMPPTPFGSDSALRILFVGRNRQGSRLDLLFGAVRQLVSEGLNLHLDVVGIDKPSDNVVSFHGSCHGSELAHFASSCHIGVYPGDAGLSVLHYMALGLCPVVHSDFRKHSGPEPLYVQDGVTGCLFERASLSSLKEKLVYLYKNHLTTYTLRVQARHFAEVLHQRSLSSDLALIMNEDRAFIYSSHRSLW